MAAVTGFLLSQFDFCSLYALSEHTNWPSNALSLTCDAVNCLACGF